MFPQLCILQALNVVSCLCCGFSSLVHSIEWQRINPMSTRKGKRPSAGGESGKKKVKVESVEALNEKFPNVMIFKTLMQLDSPVSVPKWCVLFHCFPLCKSHGHRLLGTTFCHRMALRKHIYTKNSETRTKYCFFFEGWAQCFVEQLPAELIWWGCNCCVHELDGHKLSRGWTTAIA